MSKSDKLERVLRLLDEHECLPYAADKALYIPEDRDATADEKREWREAQREAKRSNRDFATRVWEACQ